MKQTKELLSMKLSQKETNFATENSRTVSFSFLRIKELLKSRNLKKSFLYQNLKILYLKNSGKV
jgi:hypothetical protein